MVQRVSYGRKRALTLAAVYVLMGLHIVHWKLRGSTLAPLELNEVMYTLELGILTAGFLLMVAAVLSVLIFGRFFCSWACHILALEDLAAWILGKFGIRPKPVRSRLLRFVAPGALVYMFVWPQLQRLFAGQSMPALHLRMDGEGWASFVTSDYWRNLPGPIIAFLTFAVCGFLIVYFLGTRSFCGYVCPYGAAFGLADRIAPGRIRERQLGACNGCAKCTAVCSSQVRVHEEILMHGQVIDPGCLKDLDCVSVCPVDAISFGFAVPRSTFVTRVRRVAGQIGRAIFVGRAPRTQKKARPAHSKPLRARTGQLIVGRRYDFAWWEECLVGILFLAAAWALRGLYGRVPFLLALGAATIVAIHGVISLRLVRASDVRFGHLRLKARGRLSRYGTAHVFGAVLLAMFFAHSGWIRMHESLGERAYSEMKTHMIQTHTNPPRPLIDVAAEHARAVEQWGLVRTPELYLQLASIYSFDNPPVRAATAFEQALQCRPDDHEARFRYASVLKRLGRAAEAEEQLRRIAQATERPAGS